MNLQNPYLPPRTESVSVLTEFHARRDWLRRFLVLQLLVVGAGFLLAVFAVTETIMVSGLVLVSVGIVLSVLSWRCSDFGYLCCGLSGVAFSIFILLLIYLNAWSPSEARVPVLVLVSIYGSCLLLAFAVLFRRKRLAADKESSVDPGID